MLSKTLYEKNKKREQKRETITFKFGLSINVNRFQIITDFKNLTDTLTRFETYLENHWNRFAIAKGFGIAAEHCNYTTKRFCIKGNEIQINTDPRIKRKLSYGVQSHYEIIGKRSDAAKWTIL